jgi:DNA-directed RNA polymerase specialized sigma24 family protein
LSENFTTYHSDLLSQEWPEDDIREDMLVHVVETLGTVNPVYRNLLMYRYIDNKSVEEISAISGKSYKAAESLLSRAREAFRKKFQENKWENE